MNKFHILLTVYWVLFACVHSIMASLKVKEFLQRKTGRYFRYYRLVYSCIQFILLPAIVMYQYSQPSIQLFSSRIVLLVGIPLSVLGLYVMGVCIRKYFANLSGVDVFTKDNQPMVLEIGGLHRYMRHPLYAGTLLFMWSLFLMFPFLNNLIACVVNTLYVLIGITLEERKLVLEYGDQYVRYAKKTPKLIPFLHI